MEHARARYGGPVHPDSLWFTVAMDVLDTEFIIKELPERAEFYKKKVGRSLCFAALQRKLHEVVNAMQAIESTEVSNPLHGKVLEAYGRSMAPDGSPPTLAELRAQFLRKHGAALLPKEFVLRKMVLRTLKLPLSRAKRGRPKIRNLKR